MATLDAPIQSGTRIGGDLVVESLRALGADTCFGIPGQHALGLFEALRRSGMRYVGLRNELTAGFAADGYARVSGRPAPLLLSTGPGALISLAALMEADGASVPVVAISSQIPSEGLGRRRGHLHELRDQIGSFRRVVKHAVTVPSAAAIPSLLEEAWSVASAPPTGPVFLEIPQDVLLGATDVPAVEALDARRDAPAPRAEVLDAAAELLEGAQRPAILAGGGVVRGGAWQELLSLAERLRAPVAETFGGRGAFPDDHPLACGSFLEDAHLMELLADADVLLCAGTGLGELSSNYFTFRPRGRLVHVDADPEKVGVNHAALCVVGDARTVLAELGARVPARRADGAAEGRVVAVREAVEARLASQGRDRERGLLRTIRAALPADAACAWDMTILGYWAWNAFPAGAPRRFLSAQASGTLGYAWPAAIGAKAALPDTPVLAVVGDGGSLYGLQELASARQAGLAAKLLIVDDGGYGILREYQRDAFGATFGVDLTQPDFPAVCRGFGVPVRESAPERLADDLAWALEVDGPAVVVLPTELAMFAPTHLP
jgi:acetolactate synthase I/II/III large subunit